MNLGIMINDQETTTPIGAGVHCQVQTGQVVEVAQASNRHIQVSCNHRQYVSVRDYDINR